MKGLVLILIACHSSIYTTYGADDYFRHLQGRFSYTQGHMQYPLTIKEVAEKYTGYVKAYHDDDLNVDLYSYPDDPRVFVLFDSFGNIAGIRMSIIVKDMAITASKLNVPFTYDYDKIPLFTKGNYWNTDLYYTSVLFTSPEKLRAGGRKDTLGLVAEDIYIKLKGTWTIIPRQEKEIEGLGFTKQGCWEGMGQHYFLGMSPTSVCAELEGVIAFYHEAKLVGVVPVGFGHFSTETRLWFDNPPIEVVWEMLTYIPDCITEWATNFGLTAIHLYFMEQPDDAKCPNKTTTEGAYSNKEE